MTDSTTPPEPAPAKEPRPPGSTLAIALLAYTAGNTLYGLPMLLAPGLIWGTIAGAEGDARTALESTRWVGALLLALAFGALLLLIRKPTGQRTFVTTLALGDAAMAAALVLGIASGDFDGIVDAWFVWATALGLAAISGYLWWARFKARSLLHL
jgi:hypothetical protein